jgi:DNA-binding CsgD family transcriptional regulator
VQPVAGTRAGRDVVGREAELAAVESFLAAASSSAQTLVLEGEPGVGKTTLWRAGVTEARRRGLRVLACSPGSGETSLAFTGLGDLLREALRDVRETLPAPQRHALEVALLLESPAGAAADQRTVAAATLSALGELAERGPVVVAVDDLQWVDDASQQALGFAARRIGEALVSVFVARRPEARGSERPALEVALEHRHEGRIRRIAVGPLSPAALHGVIQGELGTSFPHGVLARLHATSGGNPFYALELARALLRRPGPLEPGQALPVPDSLHELVRARLDVLPAPVQDLLTVAAALADPTLETVDAMDAGASVDDAVRAGVLELDSTGRLRFAHPLLASAAYGRLGPRARRELHGRLATVVGGEERARHLALAASGPSAPVAEALHEAARHAAGRGAISVAAAFAEEAVRLTSPDDADRMTQRRLDAAGFEMRNGDTERARAHLEPLVLELPPGPTRAGVVLRLARLHEHGPAGALELCREAIAEAGDDLGRSAEAHQLAAEMAMLSGDVVGGLDYARTASGLAEAAGDQAILIESLGTLCHYETYRGTIASGLIERAVELERRAPRPSNNYSPREILGLRLMYGDRLDEARVLLEESLAAATELGDELDRASLLIHLTQLECRAGRLADADRNARDAVLTHEQAGFMPSAARFATSLVSAHLGLVDVARAAGEEGASLGAAGRNEVFRVLNLWALGFLELSLGNATAAATLLRSLPEELHVMGYGNPGVRPVYADSIEARIAVDDLHVDAEIDTLESRGRELDYPWALATAARCRGLLLAARGDPDGAIGELERALTEHRRSPQPLEHGRTLLALGATQRRAKRRGDARETLTAALALFDEVGTPLWAEKAAAELARIPGRAPSSGGLTETERRIAELVATGLANKEVASRLFVTVRTVEANLSKVYAKLGVRSRTELAGRIGRPPG